MIIIDLTRLNLDNLLMLAVAFDRACERLPGERQWRRVRYQTFAEIRLRFPSEYRDLLWERKHRPGVDAGDWS